MNAQNEASIKEATKQIEDMVKELEAKMEAGWTETERRHEISDGAGLA